MDRKNRKNEERGPIFEGIIRNVLLADHALNDRNGFTSLNFFREKPGKYEIDAAYFTLQKVDLKSTISRALGMLNIDITKTELNNFNPKAEYLRKHSLLLVEVKSTLSSLSSSDIVDKLPKWIQFVEDIQKNSYYPIQQIDIIIVHSGMPVSISKEFNEIMTRLRETYEFVMAMKLNIPVNILFWRVQMELIANAIFGDILKKDLDVETMTKAYYEYVLKRNLIDFVNDPAVIPQIHLRAET
jgi:hypothetical protein